MHAGIARMFFYAAVSFALGSMAYAALLPYATLFNTVVIELMRQGAVVVAFGGPVVFGIFALFEATSQGHDDVSR